MDHFETAKQFFLAGLHLLEVRNYQAAEKVFARSLELLPDRVSTLNNLSAVKIKLEKFEEAEALARKAAALEVTSAEAWANLGIALSATQRHEEALQTYDRAIQGNPVYARAWLNKAITLLEIKRFDEALTACDRALELDPGQHEILHTKSQILNELKQTEEALKIYFKSLETRAAISPVFAAERRATQKADVLVINENPGLDGSLKSFETLHLHCSNFPGQLARLFQEYFHFTFVFGSDALKPSNRSKIPQPDLVLNNCVNGELVLSTGKLPGLIELVDSFGVPVVNHPAKTMQTTRDASAKLLEEIPGLRVPKTRRFSLAGKTREQLVCEIEEHYDYPLITRTLISQEGKGMTKVDSRSALLAVLASDIPEKFFVTEFVDSRGKNNFFRKIRAAIVHDEIIVVRVDYDTQWKIYGRKSDERVAFYLNNSYLLEEENRICANPEAGLGKSAIQSLRAIRDRIPLDAFGIDFDLDPDGLLVFYEANATMNLLSTARPEVPYPKDANDRLMQAFQSYLMSLVTRC